MARLDTSLELAGVAFCGFGVLGGKGSVYHRSQTCALTGTEPWEGLQEFLCAYLPDWQQREARLRTYLYPGSTIEQLFYI